MNQCEMVYVIPDILLKLKLSGKPTMVLANILSFTIQNKSLDVSNSELAKSLNVSRRMEGYIIADLQKRELIINKGKDDWHRKLVVNMPELINQLMQDVANEDMQDIANGKDKTLERYFPKLCKMLHEHMKDIAPITKDNLSKLKKETKNLNRDKGNIPLGDDNVTENPKPEPQSQSDTQELPELLTVYQETYPEDPHRFVSAEQAAFNERCNAAIRTETEDVS